MAVEVMERCIEPRCDRARSSDGLRCVLHASRLGQTKTPPLGFPSEPPPVTAEIVPAAPAALAVVEVAPTDTGRTLTALGYGAIAAGWAGIGLLFADLMVPGAILSVGGHAAALGLALAAALRRQKRTIES